MKEVLMPDYRAMYFHLAGRVAGAVDVLAVATDMLQSVNNSLGELGETLKDAQQKTEEMFINDDGES